MKNALYTLSILSLGLILTGCYGGRTVVRHDGSTVYEDHNIFGSGQRTKKVAESSGTNTTNSRALELGARKVVYEEGKIVAVEYDTEARATNPRLNNFWGFGQGYAGVQGYSGSYAIGGPTLQTGWIRNDSKFSVQVALNNNPLGVIRPGQSRTISLPPGNYVVTAQSMLDGTLIHENQWQVNEVREDGFGYVYSGSGRRKADFNYRIP